MARPEKAYQKLPGKSSGIGLIVARRARLWLAKDHLLDVESTGWSERYRRYYLRDIQALIVRRTNGWIWTAVVLGMFCALFGIGAFVFRSTPAAMVMLATVAVGLFMAFLASLLLGPTCAVQIRTAVSSEPLRPLNRLRVVRKCFARLLPLIEQAQGRLAPAEIPARLAAAGEPDFPPATTARDAVVSSYRGGLHLAMFLMLLADAGITLAYIFHNDLILTTINLTLALSLSAVVIIALVRQYRSALPPVVHGLTWGAMGYLAAGFGVAYIEMIVRTVEGGQVARNQWDMLKFSASHTAQDSVFTLWTAIVGIAISLFLGIAGLIALGHFRRQNPKPE